MGSISLSFSSSLFLPLLSLYSSRCWFEWVTDCLRLSRDTSGTRHHIMYTFINLTWIHVPVCVLVLVQYLLYADQVHSHNDKTSSCIYTIVALQYIYYTQIHCHMKMKWLFAGLCYQDELSASWYSPNATLESQISSLSLTENLRAGT